MTEKYGLKLNPMGWFGISDEEWINPLTTALVIVDMQNFDANREWLLIGARGTGTSSDSQVYYYKRVYDTVIPNIQKLLAYFRKHDLIIVHVFFASWLENASDMPPIWRLRFDQHAEDMGRLLRPNTGSPEMDIIEELKPLPGENVLSKVTGSTFLSTNLHNMFRYQGIKSFIACGVWGNSCVEDTVRTGCDLGYLVTYVEDGTASPDEEFHRASTRVLGEMYCQVRDTDWILEQMKKFKMEK